MMLTDPSRSFDWTQWELEPHVREALSIAPALSGGGRVVDSRGLFHAIALTSKRASASFRFIAKLLEGVQTSGTIRVPEQPDLTSLEFAGPLARSLNRVVSRCSAGTVWGRDLVSIAVLAGDNPSCSAILEESKLTLAELQDRWFEFLAEHEEHRTVAEWREWWSGAGVPLPEQRSNATRTYLMTRTPGEEVGWFDDPPAKVLQDIDEHGSALRLWRTECPQEVYAGERVFLHRQGRGANGLVGIGRIAGPVEGYVTIGSEEEGYQVLVRWTRLYSEPVVALATLEQKGEPSSQWHVSESGIPLSEVNALVAESVWKLAVDARDRGIPDFLSDRVSGADSDLLDVEREAHAVARVIASRDLEPPLSVGVFGDWGSGKTFFMELVHEHIAELAKVARAAPAEDAQTAFHSNIVQIRFNAWHYIETNLWASLVDQIFTSLDSWLRKEETASAENIEGLFGRLETPRRLLLESIHGLVTARQEKEAAANALESADSSLMAARQAQQEHGSLGTFNALYAALKADTTIQGEIAEVAEELGIPGLQASAQQMSELLEQAREEGNRLSLIAGSIAHRLGQPLWLVASLLGLVLVPLGMSALGQLGEVGLGWLDPLLAACRSGIAQLSAALAAAGASLGAATGFARKAIDKLQAFDRKLESARENQLSRFMAEVLLRATAVDDAHDVAESAREDFSTATSALRSAMQEVDAAPRERLLSFIRGKVASREYAKELSLITTIRKDFEQLAHLMVNGAESPLADDLEEARLRWQEQLDDLVARKLLVPEDMAQIPREPFSRDDMDVPRFERVVLYVDDLDRCPPEKVVDVLQAIHLLLYFRLFIVVVAVDSRWVSNALIDRYPGLLRHSSSIQGSPAFPAEAQHDAASPRDYLEKIFQIPYWVRPVEKKASYGMVKSLVGGWPADDAVSTPGGKDPTKTGSAPVGGKSPSVGTGTLAPSQPVEVDWIDPNPSSLELTEREKKFLAEMAQYVNPSPRTLRRFVNVYRVLRSGLKDEDLQKVTREGGDPTLHRALIAQLAVVSGAPHLCELFFEVLRELDEWEKPILRLTEKFADQHAAHGPREEAESIAGVLTSLRTSGQDNWAMIEALREHADTVKRYSFGTQALTASTPASAPDSGAEAANE